MYKITTKPEEPEGNTTTSPPATDLGFGELVRVTMAKQYVGVVMISKKFCITNFITCLVIALHFFHGVPKVANEI